MNCDPCLKYSEKDLIKSSMEVVAFSKFVEGKPCKSIGSFAYMDTWENVNIETFGQSVLLDDAKEYVYVKNKQELFPALIISPTNAIIENGIFENYVEEVREYEVLIMDNIDLGQMGCDECGYCDNRNIEEIKKDLLIHWKGWIEYIKGVELYEVAIASGVEEVYMNKEYMAALEEWNGEEIISKTRNYPKSKEIVSDLRALNGSVTLRYVEIGAYIAIVGNIRFKDVGLCETTVRNFGNVLNNKYASLCH